MALGISMSASAHVYDADAHLLAAGIVIARGLVAAEAKTGGLGALEPRFGPGAMDINQPFDKAITRIYEANPKHGLESYIDSGGRVVSRAPRGDLSPYLMSPCLSRTRVRIESA